MVYLLPVIVIISIMDIKDLLSGSRKKDVYVYAALMLLVVAFGIFYYADPERDSFAKILVSFISMGKED